MKNYEEQVLSAYVAPAIGGTDLIFMEDGNKSHGLQNANIRRLKSDLGITCFDWWPPSSPDFNPLENIWRTLKQRLKNRRFLTVEELKQALRDEWQALTQLEIQTHICRMSQRMEEAIARNGMATRY